MCVSIYPTHQKAGTGSGQEHTWVWRDLAVLPSAGPQMPPGKGTNRDTVATSPWPTTGMCCLWAIRVSALTEDLPAG